MEGVSYDRCENETCSCCHSMLLQELAGFALSHKRTEGELPPLESLSPEDQERVERFKKKLAEEGDPWLKEKEEAEAEAEPDDPSSSDFDDEPEAVEEPAPTAPIFDEEEQPVEEITWDAKAKGPRYTPICWTNWEAAVQYSRKPILSFGPPGTGKSGRARMFAETQGLTAACVQCYQGMDSTDLLGLWVPRDGGTFQISEALRQWSEGGVVILDEIDRAMASEAEPILMAFLDDPMVARITVPDGRTFTASPVTRVLATTNMDPKSLPEAIQSRFALTVHINQPSPNLMELMKPPLRPMVLDSYRAGNRLVDTRAALTWTELVDNGCDEETASKLVFRDAAKEMLAVIKVNSAK